MTAIVALISYTLLVPGLQANSISTSIENALGISPGITGLVLVVLTALVIFGGVKRIGSVASTVVPFMAMGYIVLALVIVFSNLSEVPGMFALIFSSAFGADATLGGIVGAAIAWGVRRAILASGAGLGEGTYTSASAEASHPAKQGLVQAFSIYVDIFFVCTATGLMILITGMYNVTPVGHDPIISNLGNVEPGAIFAQQALESVFPGFGSLFIAISIFFFAFTTLLAYAYVSETTLIFLTRKKVVWLDYAAKAVLLITIYYGSVQSIGFVWNLGDVGFAIMAWLNLITMVLLAKPALKIYKDYEKQRKSGKDPVFNPVEIGIEGADFWEKDSGKLESPEYDNGKSKKKGERVATSQI